MPLGAWQGACSRKLTGRSRQLSGRQLGSGRTCSNAGHTRWTTCDASLPRSAPRYLPVLDIRRMGGLRSLRFVFCCPASTAFWTDLPPSRVRWRFVRNGTRTVLSVARRAAGSRGTEGPTGHATGLPGAIALAAAIGMGSQYPKKSSSRCAGYSAQEVYDRGLVGHPAGCAGVAYQRWGSPLRHRRSAPGLPYSLHLSGWV